MWEIRCVLSSKLFYSIFSYFLINSIINRRYLIHVCAIETIYLFMHSNYNEYDFVKYDLLPGGSEYASQYNVVSIEIVLIDRSIEIVSQTSLYYYGINMTYYETHPLRDEFIGKGVYVNGGDYFYSNQMQLLHFLRPKVVFLLSQEEGTSDGQMKAIGSITTLFLKNYCFGSTSRSRTKNTLFVPLPYVRGMFGGQRTVHNTSIAHLNTERQYTWSFFGNHTRYDRAVMIKNFAKLTPNVHNLILPTNKVCPPVYVNIIYKLYAILYKHYVLYSLMYTLRYPPIIATLGSCRSGTASTPWTASGWSRRWLAARSLSSPPTAHYWSKRITVLVEGCM